MREGWGICTPPQLTMEVLNSLYLGAGFVNKSSNLPKSWGHLEQKLESILGSHLRWVAVSTTAFTAAGAEIGVNWEMKCEYQEQYIKRK